MGQGIFSYKALAFPSDSCRVVDTVPCTEEDSTRPRFRFQHSSVSTTDDDSFFVVSKYSLGRIVRVLQGLFAIYTLYLWNYASFVRFIFSQRKMDYAGELYLAICVCGLFSVFIISCFTVYRNSVSQLDGQRRRLEQRSENGHDDLHSERIQLKTLRFVFSRRVLAAMDSHHSYHEETKQRGGDPASYLIRANYIFIAVLTIIDFGIVVDATSRSGKSYTSKLVGSLGFLQILCLCMGLVATFYPPRRAYQEYAQAYLVERIA